MFGESAQKMIGQMANCVLLAPSRLSCEISSMRSAYPGGFGYGQQSAAHHGNGVGAPSAGHNQETDRLSSLKRAIDSIEQRLQQAPQPVPPYAQPNFAQPHYGAGEPMAAPYAAIVPPVAPAQQSELGLMQAQLNQLASQIGMPQAHHPMAHQGFHNSIPQNSNMGGANAAHGLGDIHSIAAQIARRQQALNAGASQPSSMSMQPNAAMTGMSAPNTAQSGHPAAASGDMGDIIKQLGELKNELSTIKQEVSKPVPEPKVVPSAAVPQEEIDRIASAIADLQSNQAPDEATFERLTAELDGLRQSMSQDMRSVVRNELDAEQPQSQSHLTERLDALAYGLNEISTQSANHVTPRVENLANQLENLRVTIDDLPQTLAISRLEERLTDMTARLDSFASEMASGPNAGPNDVDLTSIESRLDEVARALVAVSNAGRQAPEIDLSAVERVEARVTDLARTLDSVAAQSNTADELDNLAVRIDGLTERLGSFEKYAESGDLGGASAMFAAPDTGVIEDQLRALNNRVEQAAAQSQTQTLEDQIRALSARVEEAANINSTASQMSNLEAQIGQILRHLNKSDAGVAVDFSPVEARLGQIETQLMSNQNFSLEAAQQAAQQAVSLMGPQSESAQIIEALSNDLRNLQNVAEGGNSQNAATILEVQNTLQHVVQRLGSIEGAIEDAAAQPAYIPEPQPAPVAPAPVQTMADISATDAAPMNEPQNLLNERTDETVFAADGLMDAADSEEQLGVIHKAALDAGLIQDPSSAPIRVDAPSIDPNYTFDSADNRPLEPGVPTSDIDQMVKQASEQLNAVQSGLPNADGLNVTMPAPEPVEAAGESRPDAIAAARRALQATTAEMNAVRDEAAKEPKPSAVGGLKAKLESLIPNFDVSKLRKPLVMGAAALLLAIVAFKGVSMFSGGADKPVAEVDTPAIEMSANSGTKVDDATGDAAAETTAEAPKVVRTVGEGADDNQVASADSQNEGDGATTLPDAGSDASETETPVVTDEGQSETEPQVASVTDSDGAVESSTEVTTPSSTSTYDVPSAAGSAALVAAASAGEPKALYQLGMRYSDGTEVKRNMQESAKWFERSAETGFAPAQYSIGSLYEKGIGVERDVVKASQWYEKAAGQGNARAMHNLAVIQAMGNPPEVQPDMDKAVGWFQKAADLGIKDSQFNLGILYGQGMGVPQNLGTSYKWFALAAKTGDSDANKKRDEVANAMDPDDLDDARKEVNNWAPKKIDAEVNRVSVPAEWKGRGSASGQAAKTNGAESVKKAQMLLNQRGFSVGEPDGLMGPKTKKAIMEFQRGAGIPVNGKVDLKLLKALNLQT